MNNKYLLFLVVSSNDMLLKLIKNSILKSQLLFL